MTLRAGETPVAAAIVLRHLDRAFYFKLGVDEALCKVFAGRATDAGTDPASLRRSGDSPGRFHRRPPTIP